jgi:CBS domain-containing protein
MADITARDVMTKDVTTVTEDLPIEGMIQQIRETRYSGLPVVDANGKAIGLISQNDVLRGLAYLLGSSDLPEDFQLGKRKAGVQLVEAAGKADRAVAVAQFLARPVKDVMTPSLESCSPDTPAAEVCNIMVEKRIHRVVVLDGDGKVAGLVSATDLVRRFGEELRRG